MNSITKPLRGISAWNSQFFATATLGGAWLLSATLCAQNPEWMLFSPKTAGVPTAGILGVSLDPDGRVWTACTDLQSLTGYGLGIFDGRKWTVYNTGNSKLPANSAFAFAFDKSGNAWIGTINFWGPTGGYGLVKFSGTNWTVYTTRNSGLPSDNIWAGTIDPKGRIWLATGAGVAGFDGTIWTVFNNRDVGLPKNWFSAIAADPKGNIWVGTYETGGGVAKFDGQTWTAYTRQNSGITDDTVLNIAFDPAGNTWFSGNNQVIVAGSLVKFGGENWTTYTTANSKLPGGWALTVDSQGTIWAGGGGILGYFSDNTGGLGRLDGQTWTVYKRANSGMPARKVWGLASDRYGNIWMGTESGLVAYRQGGVVLPRVLNLNRTGKLQIPSDPGKNYQLEVTSGLSASPDWSLSGGGVSGTGNPISWDISMAAERRFYRVKISQ